MTTTRKALDLSAYQGVPDFAQLKRDGIEVVIVKLTEGVSGIDSRGLANVTAARAAGLRVLPYHFFRGPAVDEERQAANFVEQIIAAGLEGERACIDFEDEGAASIPNADGLVRFLRALRGALQRRPIVYTNTDKATRANLAAVTEIAALSDLWLARWASTPGAVPAPWSQQQLVLWQTGGGLVAGVRGTVDEDVVMGDLDGDLKDEGPETGETSSARSGPSESGLVATRSRPSSPPTGSLPPVGTSRPPGLESVSVGPQKDLLQHEAGAGAADSASSPNDAPATPAAQEPPPDIVAVPCDDFDAAETLETGALAVKVGGEVT